MLVVPFCGHRSVFELCAIQQALAYHHEFSECVLHAIEAEG